MLRVNLNIRDGEFQVFTEYIKLGRLVLFIVMRRVVRSYPATLQAAPRNALIVVSARFIIAENSSKLYRISSW